MGHGVQRFTDLRAWQTCDAYKKAVYRVCRTTAIANDRKLREQLEKSVAGPPAHVAEGFGRFNPGEFARYTVIARASLMESQNHLLDAVDKDYISEESRAELDALAVIALQEVTGLMEYLLSPEALRNARLVRERRLAARQQRRGQRGLRRD
jgi:four helix bundle protein